MSPEDISFSEISDVHRNERRSKTLTKLPNRFFESADGYLNALKQEYDKEGNNHSSPKNMMLQDNIKKLDKRIKEIYEMRERKIAISSIGSANPPDNMTHRDKSLFSELVEVLGHYKSGGETRAAKERTPIAVTAPVTEPVERQTEFIKENEEQTESLKDVAVVQVLEDVAPFVDVDNTYVLKKDDVVSLPNQFADLLSSKGKVRIIDA